METLRIVSHHTVDAVIERLAIQLFVFFNRHHRRQLEHAWLSCENLEAS